MSRMLLGEKKNPGKSFMNSSKVKCTIYRVIAMFWDDQTDVNDFAILGSTMIHDYSEELMMKKSYPYLKKKLIVSEYRLNH